MDITERKCVEQALRESEFRYRQLFEMESDAIFLIENETGRILDVNLAAQALYGYSREEFLSMRNEDVSAEPEKTHEATQSSTTESALLKILLRRHRKKDGTIIPVEISGRFFNFEGRNVHIAAIRDITERRQAQELLESWSASLERRVAERTAEAEKYARQLQALTGRLVRVEENERQRITDVLHEDVQQTLVAARMKLGVVLGAARVAATQEALNSVDDMLSRSIQLTRSLVQGIAVPSVHDGDMTFAVGCLAQQMKEKFGMTVSLTADEGLAPVSENVYLCFYRAVQELLFNSVKHAGVSKSEVRLLHLEEKALQVTVSDQGCGFSREVLAESESGNDGFGLFSIRERIEGLGGRMDVISAAGKGTTVILTVPTCE
jgi:two-component system CheB/CheR fusion protein